MLKYLLIGLIVQIVIMIERIAIGKVEPDTIRNPLVLLGVIIGSMVSILAWPIAIVSEAYYGLYKGL
jgi:hypothetical protein